MMEVFTGIYAFLAGAACVGAIWLMWYYACDPYKKGYFDGLAEGINGMGELFDAVCKKKEGEQE